MSSLQDMQHHVTLHEVGDIQQQHAARGFFEALDDECMFGWGVRFLGSAGCKTREVLYALLLDAAKRLEQKAILVALNEHLYDQRGRILHAHSFAPLKCYEDLLLVLHDRGVFEGKTWRSSSYSYMRVAVACAVCGEDAIPFEDLLVFGLARAKREDMHLFLSALYRIQTPRAVQELIAYLPSEDMELAALSARYIGLLNRKECIPLLKELLTCEDTELRVACLKSLEQLEYEGVSEEWKRFVKGDDEELSKYVTAHLIQHALFDEVPTQTLVDFLLNNPVKKVSRLKEVLRKREDAVHVIGKALEQFMLSSDYIRRKCERIVLHLEEILAYKKARERDTPQFLSFFMQVVYVPAAEEVFGVKKPLTRTDVETAILGEVAWLDESIEVVGEQTIKGLLLLFGSHFQRLNHVLVSFMRKHSHLALKPLLEILQEPEWLPDSFASVPLSFRESLIKKRGKACKKLMKDFLFHLQGQDERFVHLRALLALPANPLVWDSLCILLEHWPLEEGLEAAESYANAHLARWPEALRVAPQKWWQWGVPTKSRKPWSIVRVMYFENPEPFRSQAVERIKELWNQSGPTTQCTRLILRSAYLSDGMVKTLFECEELLHLRYLDLTRAFLNDRCIQYIVECPYLKNLEVLDVSSNKLTKKTWKTLFASPHLQQAQIITHSSQYSSPFYLNEPVDET